MITRENIYFINLRQAYFFSPLYANRISSKTVLFTSVPEDYLDEARIRKMYGEDKVKNVWLVPDVDDLAKKVQERDKTAFRLEGAETKLIKVANAARVKSLKNGTNDEESHATPANGADVDGESGSVAAKWIKPSQRPTHRTKPLIGKKVDTINWSRGEIGRLNPEIEAMQAKLRAGDAKLMNSVFVEFYTQNEAQAAYQMGMSLVTLFCGTSADQNHSGT